jgi:hypothetical protein
MSVDLKRSKDHTPPIATAQGGSLINGQEQNDMFARLAPVHSDARR